MSVVTFLRIIFIILSIIGVSFVFPIGTAVACGEFAVLPSFVIPMLISFVLGAAAIFVKNEKRKFTISTRGVFVIVSGAWIAISFFGTIPLAASGYIPNFTNAFFESVSGFSTTGASVIVDLDVLPRSLNLWRCEMHWLGGMGVIALTVALLPLLGVGGFRLIKAETTGVDKGKITPKITTTAKTLWILYVSLTAAQTVLLCIAGMDFVSALSYSFSTLGTGGYSVTNAGFEGYSEAVEIICTVFMILGGINFSLYFYAITGKWNEVRKNSELKAYAGILFVAMFGVTLILIPYYHSVVQALRFATFHVASIMTTTGFATADYTLWPQPAQFILFVLFFVGGSAGSTAGGFKVVRWLVLAKQA
ncbi:MAG: TrkH family potassium uptake protein, partial [Treponemataceae bacterium]|nr:TrkH family potassium uptake protein [Treponemataceae bacterium]